MTEEDNGKKRKRLSLRDRIASRQAGIDGMDAASDAEGEDWMGEAGLEIMLLPEGWTGTGEDIRYYLRRDKGMDEPHTPHVWGALINACVRDGMLEIISLDGRMRAVSSHHRRTPIYRRHYGEPA